MFLQMSSQAFIPSLLASKNNTWLKNVLICLGGAVLLSLLAQIAIPLPFTPVPITGQTFGVALMALTFGQNRGIATLGIYLLAGAAGLPVFADAHSGLTFGPTIGYLVGMLLASIVMGSLADHGWTSSFNKSLVAAFIGSAIVFTCGLTVLAFFVPAKMLLMAGLLPFLPGSLIKDTFAAFIAHRLSKKIN